MGDRVITIKEYYQLLYKYLRVHRVKLVLLFVLVISNVFLQLLNPQLIKQFIDSIQRGEAGGTLIYLASLFILIAILFQIIRVITVYFGNNLGWIVTNKLRTEVFAHCLRLDMSFHNTHSSGELIERIDGDINRLSNFFSSLSMQLLSNVILLFGILFLLYWEDWRIGLALTVFVIFSLVILHSIRNFAVPFWTKFSEWSAAFFGFTGEYLTGTEDLRSNGAVRHTLYKLYIKELV